MVNNVKNIFLNVFLTVLIVLLFLAILEIILSQTFTKIDKYNNELFKERILEGDTPYKPNAYVIFEGTGHNKLEPTVVKINSQGLRDYEYTIEKSQNTFRILGLGDSSTWGHGVELDETYLKKLEKKLNSANNGIRYEVINFGVGGYDTLQSVNLLKMKGLAYKPDLVILLCSPNDAKLDGEIGVQNKEEVTRKGITLKKSLLGNSYLSSWIDIKVYNLNLKKDIQKIESSPNEFWGMIEPSLLELSQMAVENNFTVVLLVGSNIVLMDEYEKFAFEHGFYISSPFGKPEDMFHIQPGQPVPSLTLKDNHPNPLGHKLIAEELYETLTSNNFIPLEKT